MRRILLFLLLTCVTSKGCEYEETKIPLGKITIIHRHYDTVESTQKTIINHVQDVSPEQWVMISAKKQEWGIGNWGRRWESPPGNVFVTFALPFNDTSTYPSTIAGVVVCKLLQDLKLNPQLRWVNNVLIGDKKIGGIYITDANKNSIRFIGIGINVSMDSETARKIDQPVTSILLQLGTAPPVKEVLTKLTHHFYNLFHDVSTFRTTFSEYDQLLAYKGKEVTIYTGPPPEDDPEQPTHFKGIFEGVTDKGFLKLRINEKIKICTVGEIVPK
jgi:BirA family biotin operon repressor/biotin-[acetyl-CoA-carboxylase] ligase